MQLTQIFPVIRSPEKRKTINGNQELCTKNSYLEYKFPTVCHENENLT